MVWGGMSDELLRLDLGDKPPEKKKPSGWEYLSDGGVIRCAFSSVKKMKVGMAGSGGKREVNILWFVEQVAPEKFEARRINPHSVPAGDPEIIPMHKLVNEFTPQLAYYEEEVLPAMKELEEKLDQGDELRKEGRLYSAEMEYGDALTVDEHNVRALFGLGLIFAGREELERTRDLLGELINVKSAFVGKNQHLFNEFGIALRKAGLFSEAIAYYDRALEFVQDDEHLFYNLARTHYENDNWEGCFSALSKANLLNPDLPVVRDLIELTVALSEDDSLLEKYHKPPVPQDVAARAKRAKSVKPPKVSLDEQPVESGIIRRARYGTGATHDLFGDLDD